MATFPDVLLPFSGIGDHFFSQANILVLLSSIINVKFPDASNIAQESFDIFELNTFIHEDIFTC